MKRLFAAALLLCLLCTSALADTLITNGGVSLDTNTLPYSTTDETAPVVYFISDISAESLVKAYQTLGVELPGKVGIKMSTGESTRSNYLRPELIVDLVHLLNGTLVECNTAYGGNRASTARHRQQAKDNGLLEVAELDILDEEDSMELPVENGARLTVDYVGSHFVNYDSYLVLSHFMPWRDLAGQSKTFPLALGLQKVRAGFIPVAPASIISGAENRTLSWRPWLTQRGPWIPIWVTTLSMSA